MRLLTRRRLLDLAARHGDRCVKAARQWVGFAERAQWRNLMEIRQGFDRSADAVEGFTIFTMRGNCFRLIVEIDYDEQTIYVIDLVAHADYDSGRWKRG